MGLLIVNPLASGVTGARVGEGAAALGDVEVRRTERRGHATDLAREAAGAEPVYVFSGDGGFNEVLNGIDAEAVRRVDARGRSPERGRAGNLRFAWELTRLLAERRGRFDAALEIAGHGPAAFALVANTDPYTYAGLLPVHVAPAARFELGLDLVAPRAVRPLALPRYLGYVFLGRGQARASDIVYGHDLDRIEIRCHRPLPLQVDGEDLGDVEEAVFEAEREAALVLV